MGRKRMEPSKAVTSPVTARCSFSIEKRVLLHSTSGLPESGVPPLSPLAF